MILHIAGVLLATTTLIGACVQGKVTRYGVSYQGQEFGCPGTGSYDTNDPTIIARGPESRYRCGDKVVVIGPAGYIVGDVVDACPGCGAGHLDLSERGLQIVCGSIRVGTCKVHHMPVPALALFAKLVPIRGDSICGLQPCDARAPAGAGD